MLPRFALLGMTTIAAMALLIGGCGVHVASYFPGCGGFASKIGAEVHATPGQRHVFDSNRRVEYL